MKKINSIGYGGRVIGAGICFLAGIPLTLKLGSYLIGKPILPVVGKLSFCLGAVILIGFAIVLAIELQQNKRLNRHYQSKRNQRRALPNNLFECAGCGNRQVTAHDTSCPVCGVHFEP